jgi:chromosome partitioning protein
VNQKGGCGKTTSSVSIAAAFARLGYRACLVDTDPQCNATESFGVESETLVTEKKFTIVDAYLKRKPAKDIALGFPTERFNDQLSLIPAVRGLSSVQLKLESELQIMIADGEKTTLDADEIRNEQRNRLKNSIDSLRGIFDVVIIDTPPSLDYLMISALIAADWFVIPVFPSGYDLKGLELLTRTVTKVRDRFNPGIKLAGVLLGNFDRTTVLDKDILSLLVRRFGETAVFRTTIGRSVRMREATVRGLTVFELPEAEQQGDQFLALVREMINRGTKKGDETLNPLPDDSVLQRIVNG